MFFSSETEVIALAGAFYEQKLGGSQWDKATQLTVTLYYGLRFPYKVAFDLISDRVRKMGLRRQYSLEQRAELEGSIHHWLRTARSFGREYHNIDDFAALVNIFIAKHWKSDEPYPHMFARNILEADTARLDRAAA